MKNVLDCERKAMEGLSELERSVKAELDKENEDYDPSLKVSSMLNDYTYRVYDNTAYTWRNLESRYWQMFGMGF